MDKLRSAIAALENQRRLFQQLVKGSSAINDNGVVEGVIEGLAQAIDILKLLETSADNDQ